jgi:predicted dehydrogenase
MDDAVTMLERGAAVIVEKPFTTTLAQADHLVAIGGARVGYAENLVFAPILAAVHARVAQFGALTHLEVRALQDLPAWGAFTTDAWGGGVLFDLGVHPLAVAMMLAAPAVVTSVRCTLRGWNGKGTRHDSDEHAEVELTFSSGLRAVVIASWQASSPLWDVQASSATAVVRAEIRPEPMLEVNGDRHEMPHARQEPTILEDLGYNAQLRSMLGDFAAGVAPLSDALFGRAVLDIACACYASAGSSGCAIAVPFPGPRDRTPLQLWRGI